MTVKMYLAVGVLGFAVLLNGCGAKPARLEGNPGSPDVVSQEAVNREVEYASRININQAGLDVDFLNENITLSPDGQMGVLVAGKVPQGKTPKGRQVDYESHLVLVDLLKGKVSSLDKGQYVTVLEWSARGDKILYRKNDSLYIYDTAKSRNFRLAARSYCGSISPDGTKVAFVQREQGLFICGADGSMIRKLTTGVGDWFPLWYPDNRTLFYFADRQAKLGDGAGRLQGLGRIAVETGQAEILIPKEKGKYRRAEWVVPGQTLLINKGWDDGFYEIVVNVETGEVHQLGENADSQTYFTAVGKADGLVYKAQGNKVIGIDAQGREQVSFTLEQPPGLRFSGASGVTISPGGKLLAYLSPERRGSSKAGGCQVWTVNSDGTNPRELTGEYGRYHAPVWAPDGRHIVVLENGNGSTASLKVKVLDVR